MDAEVWGLLQWLLQVRMNIWKLVPCLCVGRSIFYGATELHRSQLPMAIGLIKY